MPSVGATLEGWLVAGPEDVGVSVGSDEAEGGAVVGVEAGVGLGSLVGSAITTTASRPLASVPTTTAWFLTGDCEIDLGRMAMTTGFEPGSATGAQSGWRSAGQTSRTLVTLYASAPSGAVPTQPTEPAPTTIGVGPGLGDSVAAATAAGVATGAVATVGCRRKPPVSSVAPRTTTRTAIPDTIPNTGVEDHRPPAAGRRSRACSPSIDAAVRAQRSRGGSGAVSRSVRRETRSAS
jgi:hypothetical protein